MAQKTSINIKPCNLESSSPHNKRSAEYLANIRKEKFYIRTDLMARNEMWVSSQLGDTSLTDYYNLIAAMVKEKTGRAMQTKDRERVNKKTGKVTIVRGSTPLKEGVVVIKEDTTMEQLQKFCKVCNERWGVTALQVFIHRDEGHYGIPGDNATWKPNLHAHIVWDWMNHDTGKSCKLDEKAMSEMQTVLAECLEMERGISKEITGKEHLERTDFILAKQKQEAERAKAEKEAALAAKEEAEKERQTIEGENKAKEQYRQSLDTEIADKERQLKDERKAKMDSILDSITLDSGFMLLVYMRLQHIGNGILSSFYCIIRRRESERTPICAIHSFIFRSHIDHDSCRCRCLDIDSCVEFTRRITMFCSKDPHLAVTLASETRFVCECEIKIPGIRCKVIHRKVV